MNKFTVDFEEENVSIEIDGKDYPIPQRTGKLETLIKEHDKKIAESTEYDSNIDILNILLGKAAVKEIFPKGKDENLDKIAKVTYYAVKAFNFKLEKSQSEKADETMRVLDPIIDRINKVGNAEQTLNRQHKRAKK